MAIFSCYFDESGKFQDHNIVSFCGFLTPIEDLIQFNVEWGYWLRKNGIPELSMKNVLNYRRPLSERNLGTGLENRIQTLTPFVERIREFFEMGIGTAVDTLAFKGLPSETRRILGNDAHYVAFERAMHEIAAHIASPGPPGKGNQASIVMDDEEKFSVECYKLLCRMKRSRPEVKHSIVSIAFADDRYYPALQAADMLSSLTRMEALKRFHGIPYEYEPLYKLLVKDSSAEGKIMFLGGFYANDSLVELADKIHQGTKSTPPIKHLGPM